jgi:hypothetical protein
MPIATARRPDPPGIERRGYAGKGVNTGCANTIDDWYQGMSDGPRLDARYADGAADGRIGSTEATAYAPLTVKQKEETYAS